MSRVGNEFIKSAKFRSSSKNNKNSVNIQTKFMMLDVDRDPQNIESILKTSKIPRKLNTAHVRKTQKNHEEFPRHFRKENGESPLSILNQ